MSSTSAPTARCSTRRAMVHAAPSARMRRPAPPRAANGPTGSRSPRAACPSRHMSAESIDVRGPDRRGRSGRSRCLKKGNYVCFLCGWETGRHVSPFRGRYHAYFIMYGFTQRIMHARAGVDAASCDHAPRPDENTTPNDEQKHDRVLYTGPRSHNGPQCPQKALPRLFSVDVVCSTWLLTHAHATRGTMGYITRMGLGRAGRAP